MAPRGGTKPNTTPPAASGTDTPAPEATAKPVFNWDELPDAIAMPNKQATPNVHVNVLETVPETIRRKAEACLTVNTARVAAKANSTAKRVYVDYHWDVQPIVNEEMGRAFDKLICKYAKYRPAEGDIPLADEKSPKGQVTARCNDPAHYRKGDDGIPVACKAGDDGAFLGVRYSVRPFEQRRDAARLPGTA